MSRFASIPPSERTADPAISKTPGCDHPPEARKARDSGGVIASPSFYCTECKRLVLVRED